MDYFLWAMHPAASQYKCKLMTTTLWLTFLDYSVGLYRLPNIPGDLLNFV